MARWMLVMGATLAAAVAHAQGYNPPTVSYVHESPRSLIQNNNPEQLWVGDLGDPTLGNTVIYRDSISVGSHRSWYSHTNRTGQNLGYGISLVNEGSVVVSVRTRGSGFNTGITGSTCFANMFNSYQTPGVLTTINPGQRVWLTRQDSIPNSSFFSGVVDFDVTGGPLTVENIAYRSFASLTGTRSYMGYVQRVESDGTRAARQYKGFSAVSQVRLSNLNFTIDDDQAGMLNVVTRDYSLASQQYLAPVVRNFWFTNIGPNHNAQANATDMVPFFMPGWGTIHPLQISDGTGNYPNVGNWAYMYILSGQVENMGGLRRSVSVNLMAPAGGGSPVAVSVNGGVWQALRINNGQTMALHTFAVPAESSRTFEVRYILGGPGAGSLRNSVTVRKAGT